MPSPPVAAGRAVSADAAMASPGTKRRSGAAASWAKAGAVLAATMIVKSSVARSPSRSVARKVTVTPWAAVSRVGVPMSIPVAAPTEMPAGALSSS